VKVSEERWRHIDRIFHDALDRASDERDRYLERECAQDPSLALEVQALIDSFEEAGNFLEPARPSLIGQTLGSYQVTELLGVGSMGEVYLAHDLKLKRDVAIKCLPETFSRDAERIARFHREAEVLASLNHPNIAAIYDLEQVGETRLLVLELVDGEMLDRRLEKGVIPMDEALGIAAQLADALAAAHEKGIVHRDLKPSNIKISSNGVVKVLDFGIAKSSAAKSVSPEFMTPLRPGSVLGTAAYMSPEQASGLDADRTSDVWSFGCVLYEILVGRRAFEGDSVSSVLAAVSTTEPDWRLLPANTPDAIRRLLRRCLRRERRLRLHDMADARIEIDEGQTDSFRPVPATHRTSRAWIILISAVIVLSIAILFGTRRDISNRASVPERRLDLAALPTTAPTSFAISPDGRKIVFEATVDGRSSLWLLSLDSGSTRLLPGTEFGRTYSPFWAPDSKSVGFFAYSQDTTLRRIDIQTGAVLTLASIGATASGGTWNRDGIILYGAAGNIFRVADTGGRTETVLQKDGLATYLAPHFVSGGLKFLYSTRHAEEPSGAYLGDLDGMQPRRIVDADAGVEYNGSGKLFFVYQGALFAQDFDPARAELSGQRNLVAEHVTVLGPKAAMSISTSGPIVYRTGPTDSDAQLAWFDRSGKEIQTVGEPFQPDYGLALSPDARFVAYVRREGTAGKIWLHDLKRNIVTPFAPDGAEPAWSPDGTRIVYCKSNATGGIFQKGVSADSSEELLARSGLSPTWSAKGYVLFDRSTTPSQPKDLWAVRMTAIGKVAGDAFPQIQSSADERSGMFSPDGNWIAFSSNKSGRREIYVRPFAGEATEVQISTAGGVQVRWRRDGKELFYLDPTGRLMAVGIKETAGVIIPSSPTPLFSIHAFGSFESFNTAYDVSADGQRFLVLTSRDAMAPAPIKLILDWKAPQ
jgi:serine/threonine protein kinase